MVLNIKNKQMVRFYIASLTRIGLVIKTLVVPPRDIVFF